VTEGLEGWRAIAETVVGFTEAEATKQDTMYKTIEKPADETTRLPADEDSFVKPAEEEQMNRTSKAHDLKEPKQQTINSDGCSFSDKVNQEREKQEGSSIRKEVETILSVFASSKEIFWFR
jgi:hypothetical protein